MGATDILKELKKIIKGLIITICILIISIVAIVYIFLHYLSLYDFTNNVDQYIKNIDKIENSDIKLSHK